MVCPSCEVSSDRSLSKPACPAQAKLPCIILIVCATPFRGSQRRPKQMAQTSSPKGEHMITGPLNKLKTLGMTLPWETSLLVYLPQPAWRGTVPMVAAVLAKPSSTINRNQSMIFVVPLCRSTNSASMLPKQGCSVRLSRRNSSTWSTSCS